LQRWPIDFFLVAMPYTLVEQEGLEELEICAARGVSIVICAPFGNPGAGSRARRALSLPTGRTGDC
jgi:phosphatidylserine/phosphatidylglycerophosphate/cardiolipin synthase-like enzyme